jgi:hypothetical protein
MIREVGLECGWAIAIHGSLASDIDLIAVAWKEDASTLEYFLDKVEKRIAGTSFTYPWHGPHPMPCGRTVWTLPLESDHYLDMNVFDGRAAAEQEDRVFKTAEDVKAFHDHIEESTREPFERFDRARRESERLAHETTLGASAEKEEAND